jgi:hypothetical protein
MSVGPIRRLVGLLGLLALAPTAVMLATGQVSPADAALRAVATLLLTMLIGRVACWWVDQMARGFDATAGAGPVAPAEAGTPGRRAGDTQAR